MVKMLEFRASWRLTVQKLLGMLVRVLGVIVFSVAGMLKSVAVWLGISSPRPVSGPVICIAAGARGWKNIEFQEISQSAREYAGDGRVIELVVQSKRTYLGQVWSALVESEVTHYFFDPRTGSQNFLGSFFEPVVLAIMFAFRGVTPIGYCTDISERRPRLQVAFVTARTGACVCFMDAVAVRRIFPHERIVGPSIMPFSLETFERLSVLRNSSSSRPKKLVSFVGSLYEPRTTTLSQIRSALEKNDISLDLPTRKMGEPRGSDDSYWESLSGSEIQVTTTSQIRDAFKDMAEVNQLVYRATEALVSGAALVIEEVPGMTTFFQDRVHLYSFSTPQEAASIVQELLEDRKKLATVKLAGQQKIEEIIRGQVFWRSVDAALGESVIQKSQSAEGASLL